MLAEDVVIVGGGFTGCAAAAALGSGRRRVTVLEGRTGKNPRFNGELIHPPGVAILERLGLLSAMRASPHAGVPALGFAVVPGAGEPALVLPYVEIPHGRPEGYAMDHHEMVTAMRAAVEKRPGVTLRLGRRVVDVLREGERVVGVRCTDGEEFRGLVLSAEGRHSKLRGILALPEETKLLSFTAAVLVDDVDLPNAGFGHIFLGAWGPILAYEMAPRTVRMCIDLPPDVDKKSVVERLRRDYAPFVPEPLRAGMLRAIGERPFDMCATHAIYTRQCVRPGIALLGDAGGCSHPLTAAGMTICLTDVALLAGILDEGSDIDAALQQYQTRRYRFVRAREVLADALYEVFRGVDDGTRAIRHGIFRYWRSSKRARGASMALLSGHDSRLASFLTEYWRVVAQSTGGALRGEVNDASLMGRLKSLGGLGEKAVEKLRRVARNVADGELR